MNFGTGQYSTIKSKLPNPFYILWRQWPISTYSYHLVCISTLQWMGIGCMPLVLTIASFETLCHNKRYMADISTWLCSTENYPKLHWQNVNGHATIPNMIVLMNQVYTNYTLTIIRHSDWHTWIHRCNFVWLKFNFNFYTN